TVLHGTILYLRLTADEPWQGKLHFDKPRYSAHMRLPENYPRLNEMPAWYPVHKNTHYTVRVNTESSQYTGRQLWEGLPVSLEAGEVVRMEVVPPQICIDVVF
ncbi:MAG: hypothetical protein ACE5R4_17445, partial [Armatimonadota bacterium]